MTENDQLREALRMVDTMLEAGAPIDRIRFLIAAALHPDQEGLKRAFQGDLTCDIN
jgi:hypothetical protein